MMWRMLFYSTFQHTSTQRSRVSFFEAKLIHVTTVTGNKVRCNDTLKQLREWSGDSNGSIIIKIWQVSAHGVLNEIYYHIMKRHYSTNGSLRTTCNNASIRPSLITLFSDTLLPRIHKTLTGAQDRSCRRDQATPGKPTAACYKRRGYRVQEFRRFPVRCFKCIHPSLRKGISLQVIFPYEVSHGRPCLLIPKVRTDNVFTNSSVELTPTLTLNWWVWV